MTEGGRRGSREREASREERREKGEEGEQGRRYVQARGVGRKMQGGYRHTHGTCRNSLFCIRVPLSILVSPHSPW